MKGILKGLLVRIFDYAQEQSKRNQYLLYRRKYAIDETFKFNGPSILLYGEGKIRLGKQSYIGRHSTIQADYNCEVQIGSNCALSHYVKIYTSSYVADQDFIKENRNTKSGSVIIGDGVWVGANVLINPGVVIGSNSVIGANSVVNTDVEPNSIVSGILAVVIRNKKYE